MYSACRVAWPRCVVGAMPVGPRDDTNASLARLIIASKSSGTLCLAARGLNEVGAVAVQLCRGGVQHSQRAPGA